ncbi:FAD-binding domain-containing protein [Candidatus Uabimicrobium amorphum]|uniref:Uncharacterized protein n=1 Tax=Uabimicrobium amorphum TaxID=2596890 RepID=A0A5S9F3U3_UABAM|nr:FAD-binding domain-containing protein [Candidatus Uabimicrobium amorphum]BBM83794.1 hypothetical protein UABAM_02149 [Candidatus Uabimicrobium amorphum]
MSIEFHIVPEYKEILKKAQLDSYQKLMNGNVGQLISDANRSQIFRIDIEPPMFLKRTLKVQNKKIFDLLMRGCIPHADCYREKISVEEINKKNIDTMTIIAWGEERTFIFPKRGFLLVKKIDGTEVQDMFSAATPEERHNIYLYYAKLLASLHINGFFAPVRFKDIICREKKENGELKLALIDRSTNWPWPRRYTPKRAKKSFDRSMHYVKKYYPELPKAEHDYIYKCYCDFLQAK